MEDIATTLTDVIAISKQSEVAEDPGKTVIKIEEDLESYTNEFELFKCQYAKMDDKLWPQNIGEEYGIRKNQTFQSSEFWNQYS